MSSVSLPDFSKFRLANGLTSQRVVNRGSTAFVYADDVSGQYFSTDLNTHLVLDAMARGETLAAALRGPGVNAPAFLSVLPHLIAAGLMTTGSMGTAPIKPRQPAESRILFFRMECVDISAIVAALRPVGGFLFSRDGAASFAALVLIAIASVISHGHDLAAEAARVLSPSPAQILWMAVAFWAVKIIHELGHGLALAHVLDAEGRPVPPLRAGVGSFFLMPYPFTNATATWLIENKWRRALVGAAGMYVEGFIAAGAAICWANVGDGVIKNALFDIMVVAGISTVLFNMNPLLRMDGYFIATDLFEIPNLSSRAAVASRAAGIWILTGRGGLERSQYGVAAYWLASYAYRWVTFTAILIIAFHYDERAGYVVLAVTVSSLIIRPLMATVAAVRAHHKRTGDGVRPPMRRVALLGATLAAVFLIPFQHGLIVEGRSENPKLRNIYAETVGVVSVSPDGQSQIDRHIARVDNPELALRVAAAAADLELARLAFRQVLATDPERQGAQQERIVAAEAVLAELRLEAQRAVSVLGAGETWHPDPKVRLDGAWTAPSQRRVLGIVLPASDPVLKAEVEQDAADFGEGLTGRQALIRVIGEPQRWINADVVSVLEVAQVGDVERHKRAFELTLVPQADVTLPKSLQLEGKRFEVRIDRPWTSLGARLWDWLGRLTQKRFASSSI